MAVLPYLPHYVVAEHTTGNWPFTGGSSVFVDTVSPDVWDQFSPLLMSRVTNTSTFTRAVLIGAGGHQRLLPDNHTGVHCCAYSGPDGIQALLCVVSDHCRLQLDLPSGTH
jgi:hypothetical protein